MALPAYAVSWRQDDSAPVAKTSPTCYRRPTGSSERCELTVPLPPVSAACISAPAALDLALALRMALSPPLATNNAGAIFLCRCRVLTGTYCFPPAVVALQGASGGVRLVSSARTVEVYSCLPGQAPSYLCSLRGKQHAAPTSEAAAAAAAAEHSLAAEAAAAAAAPTAWAVEHRWAAHAAPPALTLRLLSLVDRDTLHLHALQLVPPDSASDGTAAGQPACSVANGSVEEADAAEASCTALAGGTAAAAAAAAAAPAPAPAPAPAAGGSQLDDVRAMLARLATEEAGDGGSSSSSGRGPPPDPRRALMAGIAKSVLRQAAAQQQATVQQTAIQQAAVQQAAIQQAAVQQAAIQQQQQQQQQQADTSAARWAPPAQHQPPPAHQHQQQEAATAALQRLEGRVAALESLCGEMHGMLRLLVARAEAPEPAPPQPFAAAP